MRNEHSGAARVCCYIVNALAVGFGAAVLVAVATQQQIELFRIGLAFSAAGNV